ncbi:growth hormone secretagogue receptor type 1-like [Lampetra fluviatilis]
MQPRRLVPAMSACLQQQQHALCPQLAAGHVEAALNSTMLLLLPPPPGAGGNASVVVGGGGGAEEQQEVFRLFPLPVLAGVTAACCLLFAVGVVGNAMTIVVVSRYKEMRSTTNLYLSSMALSDLLIFMCMPLDLYRIWQYRPWLFGDLGCKLFQYVSEGCTYATILHITALSVERYLAICFPLKAKVLITKRRVKGVIALLWSCALGSAAPVFYIVGVQLDDDVEALLVWTTAECRENEEAVRSGLLQTMIWVSTIYFFLPVFCLTVLYGLIGRRLWRRRRQGGAGLSGAQRERSHRQTVKILVLVVLAFVLCWLPFHVGRNLFSGASEQDERGLYEVNLHINVASLLLFYLSAAINPILYNIVSRRFREAALRLLGAAHPRRSARGLSACPACTDSGSNAP